MKFKSYTVLIALLLSIQIASAEKYTLVIEPIYPSEQSSAVYKPLQDWLSKKTGHEIEIIIDNNYFFYWRNALGDRTPDFTFDASHIAAYRVQKKNYRLLATTVEPTFFHLISLDIPDEGQSVESYMTGKKVIMLPNPSLASIFFKEWFTDLFTAPQKIVTALSWNDAVEIVFDAEADAAIVPEWMLNLYPNFASLLKSREMPGPTLLASPNVPDEVFESFQKALLSLADDDDGYEVIVELNTDGFAIPDDTKYKDLEKLLPGIR